MCGRFALGIPRQDIVQGVHEAYPDLDIDDWVDEDAFYPRFNVAPRSRSLVIRSRNRYDDGHDAVDDDKQDKQDTPKHRGKAVMHTMKWGLIPHWSKHEDTTLNTINAKGENLVEGGGMYTSIKGKKRCAVVCQGYYEWLKKGKDKLPHFTKHKDGKLLLLAGLYDSVTLEGSTETLWTFTIVTTNASKQFTWLHDRMPVVLSSQTQLNTWLDTSSQAWTPRIAKLVRPYSDPARPLECYAVPTDVGKVTAESPTFVEPVAQRKDGIQAMFAKQSKAGEAASPVKNANTSSSKDSGSGASGKRKRASSKLDVQKEPSVEPLDNPPDPKRLQRNVSENAGDSERKTPVGKGKEKANADDRSSESSSPKRKKSGIVRSSPRSPAKAAKSKPMSSSESSPSKITNFFTTKDPK
ncbi:hypothetical protein DFH11DRAFT_1609783 [Phellopilus nigrolimitatus]|nr:hypothetical protein DFH11DRAFT_1609783 [Phellopilus nigrolimitatus]